MEINELFAKNVERCNRWHPGGIDEWSPLEWAGAMCGGRRLPEKRPPGCDGA